MKLSVEQKKEIYKKYGNSDKDTGDVKVQIALVTHRISHLTEHLKKYKKDFDTRNTLLTLVGKRRRLLRYFKRVNIENYKDLLSNLKIRH